MIVIDYNKVEDEDRQVNVEIINESYLVGVLFLPLSLDELSRGIATVMHSIRTLNR